MMRFNEGIDQALAESISSFSVEVEGERNLLLGMRHLPRREWSVLIEQHHRGYIDWSTFEANQVRLGSNTHPQAHQAGGAVREGAALLQGIATCGHCGRKLHTHYRGKNQAPGYHCSNKTLVSGRGVYCLNVGGVQIDEAVVAAFLAAAKPAGMGGVRISAIADGCFSLIADAASM